MMLNAVLALILRFFTEFDCFAGQLRYGGWRYTYNIGKILSPSSSLPLTHPTARSLYDSSATCHF